MCIFGGGGGGGGKKEVYHILFHGTVFEMNFTSDGVRNGSGIIMKSYCIQKIWI